MATYIGLDLGGTNIKISVFDDFFHKLGEKRTPHRGSFRLGARPQSHL